MDMHLVLLFPSLPESGFAPVSLTWVSMRYAGIISHMRQFLIQSVWKSAILLWYQCGLDALK